MTWTITLAATAMLWSSVALEQPSVPAPGPERPPVGQPDTRVPERIAPPGDRSGRDASQSGVLSPGINPDLGMPPMPEIGTTRVIPQQVMPGEEPRAQPR